MFFFLQFIYLATTAQDVSKYIQVLERITKKPIEYCTITSLKNKSGGFTDSNGVLRFYNYVACDSVSVSALGFKKLILSLCYKELKNDTIVCYLSNDTIQLADVIVRGENRNISKKKYQLGHYSGAKEILEKTGYSGRTNAVYIPNINNNRNIKIVELLYSIESVQSSKVRLQVYNASNNLSGPNSPLIDDNIIINVKRGQDKIVYDVSKYNINMPKGGVFISIQWLGEIKEIIKTLNINPVINAHYDNNDSQVYYKFLDKKWEKMEIFDVKTGKSLPIYVPNFGVSVIEYKEK